MSANLPNISLSTDKDIKIDRNSEIINLNIAIANMNIKLVSIEKKMDLLLKNARKSKRQSHHL